MSKSRFFYTYKSAFKAFLFVVAMVLITTQFWFTQGVVKKLRDERREYIQQYADIYQKTIESENTENISFLYENIINKINIPMIVSSPEGELDSHVRIERIEGPPYSEEAAKNLKSMMKSMDNENPPIEISYRDRIIQLIHYGDSDLITLLNWLPVVQIIMVGLFILLGFVGFNNIRRSEQRFIWVGMAKETAHQLGTPISSLMGWTELLKNSPAADSSGEVLNDMSTDLHRLRKVAQRFSQIGSNSETVDVELSGMLEDIVQYFRRRLPQSRKSVTISENYNIKCVCRLNRDLFEWAIENLIKNGLDSMENGSGKITVTLDNAPEKSWLYIDIADTGKGMSKKHQNQIFKPGFSTKKRGWGLGLNLTKRIVENYHNGRLLIKSSRIDEGTVMRIMLKRSN